jgi:hypothetical protein
LIKVTADLTGARQKIRMLQSIPKAAQFQLESFGAETVKELKLSARELKKSAIAQPGSKSGQLWRNIGMEAGKADPYWVLVGTGVGGTQSVKYAGIQDHGGETHPRVTPRMRGWAWYMFYRTKDKKYKGMALTKKVKFDIRIPATNWFSGVIKRREPILKTMMDANHIKYVAETMTGGPNAD